MSEDGASKRRGRGQPTKRSPEREKIVLDALRRGRTQAHAAALAGCTRGTIRHWCLADSSFSSLVDEAIAQGEDALLRIVEAAAGTESEPKDAKAVQWLLSKRFWKKYGERSRVDAHVKLDVERLSDAELDGVIAREADKLARLQGTSGAGSTRTRQTKRDPTGDE